MAKQINARKFINKYFYITDTNSKLVPLEFNPTQEKVYTAIKKQAEMGVPKRVIVLKARQQGVSTFSTALLLEETITNKHTASNIIAHEAGATDNLFEMIKRYFNHLPKELKPDVMSSNAKELVFNNKSGTGLDSRIIVSVATGDSVGRSFTFKNIHMSELAKWKNISDTFSAVMQAVPDTPDTLVIIESTAHGYNEFRDMYYKAKNGENGWIAVFSPWYETPRYSKKYSGFLDFDDEELRLINEHGVTLDQLEWRRQCIADKCDGDLNKFHQEYPSTEEEAFIASGNCVFDSNKVATRLTHAPVPVKVGRFDYVISHVVDEGTENEREVIKNIRWIDDEKGFIKIYEDVKEREPYVIGGDTSGDGEDFLVGQVINNITGKQVAILRHQFDEDLYAKQMYCLGMYFNKALIAIEANYSPYSNMMLEKWRYPKIYVREVEDSFSGRIQEKFGFKTTTINRGALIANLVEVVRENTELITDRDTLDEMLTFVKTSSNKPEALVGKHDDCVMALGIAHFCRSQQSYKKEDIQLVPEDISFKFLKNDLAKDDDGGDYEWW